MSDFATYIGQPWEAGAIGPQSWDCMAFAVHVQRCYFGIEMPDVIIPDYDDPRSLVALNNGHHEHAHWRPVEVPQHGDMVLIRKPMHYGVYLDVDGGGVLHCVRGQGVVFTKLSNWLASGFGRREYLRHQSKL